MGEAQAKPNKQERSDKGLVVKLTSDHALPVQAQDF
jgi:hypothetical protein